MRWLSRTIPWAACLVLAWPGPARTADSDQAQADVRTLKTAGLATDGTALLEFFRKRTLADADRARIQELIRKLGNDSFQEREQASTDLLSLGPIAIPLLNEARGDADLEIVRRSERCLQLLEKDQNSAIAAAGARLVAMHKPAGASGVLLGYLPFSPDEAVGDEVRLALSAVAVRDGKPDRLLLAALRDEARLKRAAALEALIRAGASGSLMETGKLLADFDSASRLRVAAALVDAKDRSGVTMLIHMLADLPREQAWRAEDILCRLAGDQAPTVPLGSDEKSRQKCRDAWATWWRDHGVKLDLAKLDTAQRLLGYTLLVQMDLRAAPGAAAMMGRVIELASDGRTRWQIDNLRYPIDAQVLDRDRVLVAEYLNRTVSERNLKGEILWQKVLTNAANYPIGCQRLPNGNTFIPCRNQLLEFNSKGDEVFSLNLATSIVAAQKLRDGHIAFVTAPGAFTLLDPTGKQVKSFPVGVIYNSIGGGGIDVLPNGRVVVPQYANGKVVEFDPDGKVIWEASVLRPISVSRLPNGHTLVNSMVSPNYQVVELDRSGKEVWQYKTDSRLFRVRRR